jgi:hypothetical protein
VSADLFSVVQFFEDETYEYVRRNVPAQEAVEAARHYCSSIGAQLGTTARVIITDSGDDTVFEWQYGKGVTFPPEAAGKVPRPQIASDDGAAP